MGTAAGMAEGAGAGAVMEAAAGMAEGAEAGAVMAAVAGMAEGAGAGPVVGAVAGMANCFRLCGLCVKWGDYGQFDMPLISK